MSKIKTNAMRILDSNKIDYEIITYDNKDGKIDGVSVASKIGKDITMVYKTLVTQGASKNFYVFVIPVNEEIDFKKAAKVAEEKNLELINVKDLNKITGYIRGGCSPIGMKKVYSTFINDTAKELKNIIVSGGKIGVQLEIEPQKIINLLNAKFENITKD